jgi:hypothetical protein
MRICLHTLWLISPDRVGGTERFLIDVSKELKALGHDPFILCPSLKETSDVEGIEVKGWIPQKYHDTFIKMGANASGFMLKRLEKGNVSVDDLHEISYFVEQQLAQVDADVIHLNSFLSALFVRDRVSAHPRRRGCQAAAWSMIGWPARTRRMAASGLRPYRRPVSTIERTPA